MTYPLELHIGSVLIPVHFVCEILAYTLSFRYYLWLRKRGVDLISEENRLWIFIGAAFGAFLGSHILGCLEQPNAVKWSILYFMSNKTILGGLLGGLLGVEIVKKAIGVTTSSGDLMTYPLIMGMIIGRIGCHLEGLNDGTIGAVSSLPWAIDFGDGIPRHPVNLYDIIILGLLTLGLRRLENKKLLPNGMRFKIFMVTYLVYRFCVEYLKPVYFWDKTGLSSIQIACLGGLGYYIYLYFRTPKG